MLVIRVDMGIGEKWVQNPTQTGKGGTAGLSVGNNAFVQIRLFCKCTSIHTIFFFLTKALHKLTLQECFMCHSICSSRKTEKVIQTAAVILSHQHCHATARQWAHSCSAWAKHCMASPCSKAAAAPECLKNWSIRHQPALSKQGTET